MTTAMLPVAPPGWMWVPAASLAQGTPQAEGHHHHPNAGLGQHSHVSGGGAASAFYAAPPGFMGGPTYGGSSGPMAGTQGASSLSYYYSHYPGPGLPFGYPGAVSFEGLPMPQAWPGPGPVAGGWPTIAGPAPPQASPQWPGAGHGPGGYPGPGGYFGMPAQAAGLAAPFSGSEAMGLGWAQGSGPASASAGAYLGPMMPYSTPFEARGSGTLGLGQPPVMRHGGQGVDRPVPVGAHAEPEGSQQEGLASTGDHGQPGTAAQGPGTRSAGAIMALAQAAHRSRLQAHWQVGDLPVAGNGDPGPLAPQAACGPSAARGAALDDKG